MISSKFKVNESIFEFASLRFQCFNISIQLKFDNQFFIVVVWIVLLLTFSISHSRKQAAP